MKTILSLMTATVFVTMLPAQTTWRLADGSAGYGVYDISIYYTDPDTVFAIGYHGVLRSTDRGEHWEFIGGPGVGTGILVDPFRSDILYAAAASPGHGNRISISTDGGETWYLGGDPGVRNWCATWVLLDPADMKTVYASNGHLWRSTDYGVTWEHVSPPAAHLALELGLSAADGSVMYAGDGYHLSRSTDRGATWQYSGSPGCYEIYVDQQDAMTAYASHTNYGVHKTTDGGNSWWLINNGLPSSVWDVRGFAVHPSNGDTLWHGSHSYSNDLLHKSTDAGKSWFADHSGISDTGSIRAIAVDTLNSRVYLGKAGGSIDGIYIGDGVTSIHPRRAVQQSLTLWPAYPNPFNHSTIVRYELDQSAEVNVEVHNVAGQKVRTLDKGRKSQGFHDVGWDGRDHLDKPVASGVYIIRLQAGGRNFARKVLLVK